MDPRSLLLLVLAGFAMNTQTPTRTAQATHPEVVAINVLIVPDASMRDYARQVNRKLNETHPQPFAFDDSHVPHISVLHRFVAARDLAKIYTAVERVVAKRPLAREPLIATGLEHSPWGNAELVSVTVNRTPALAQLQAELIAALRPFAAPPGDRNAFVRSPGPAEIDTETIDYVRTFEQKHTGEKFKPHITVGSSDPATAGEMQSQPQHSTRFEAETLAIYQLGNMGTARKELWRPRSAAANL